MSCELNDKFDYIMGAVVGLKVGLEASEMAIKLSDGQVTIDIDGMTKNYCSFEVLLAENNIKKAQLLYAPELTKVVSAHDELMDIMSSDDESVYPPHPHINNFVKVTNGNQ